MNTDLDKTVGDGTTDAQAVLLSSLQQLFLTNPLRDESVKPMTVSNDVNFQKVESDDDFSFQTVHAMFGREIMQDLNERRRLKALAQLSLTLGGP